MKTQLTIEKLLEIIKILQNDRRNMPYMSMIKLVFFAERYHLRSFGFPLTGDMYYAMKHGPVPWVTKNVLNKDFLYIGFISDEEKNLIDENIVVKKNAKDKLVSFSIKNKKYAELSESAIQSIDFTLSNFGSFNQNQLIDLTHDYPEWTRYRSFFEKDFNETLREDIVVDDFFKNPNVKESDALQRYFSGVDPFYEEQEVLDIMYDYFVGKIAD